LLHDDRVFEHLVSDLVGVDPDGTSLSQVTSDSRLAARWGRRDSDDQHFGLQPTRDDSRR
jgi:hypothetical protein